MPAIARQNEPGVAVEIALALELRKGLIQHALIERLALDIESFEPARQIRGFRGIIGQQEAEAVGRLADPSRGVEPGPRTKPRCPARTSLSLRPPV